MADIIPEDYVPFVKFFDEVASYFFNDGMTRIEYDYGDFLDLGEKLGLLEQHPYHVEKYGEIAELDEGDPMYSYTDKAAEIMDFCSPKVEEH